ncbi:MAG: hypothetical protein ACI8Z9_000750 [Paraglaciecola sp.]|jgi:hypothetical protein
MMIIKKSVTCAGALVLLSSCANMQKPCEAILEVKRQEQQCQQWRNIMDNNHYPQQAITAKKHYEEAYLKLRYYRDDYDTICKGNQRAIGQQKTED